MKGHLFSIICLCGVAACFHFSPAAKERADKLPAEARDKVDKALQMGKYEPERRVIKSSPGEMIQTDSGKLVPAPDTYEVEPLFRADPGLLAKKPENKKLLEEADNEKALAPVMSTISTALRYCGFGLLGLLALIELGRTIVAVAEHRKVDFNERIPVGPADRDAGAGGAADPDGVAAPARRE